MSSEETAVAVRTENIESIDFGKMLAAVDVLVKSHFLPEAIQTKEQAAAIVLTGRELGIPTMQALRQIDVIKGKPTVKPELLLTRAYQLVLGFSHDIVERSAKNCSILFKAKGRKDYTHSFSMDDAKSLQLDRKDNYLKQPATMLFWRCVAGGLRAFCPQVTSGVYTPEELDPDGVRVTDEGEMVRVDSPKQSQPKTVTIPAEEVQTTKPSAKKVVETVPEPVPEPEEEPPKVEPKAESLTGPAKRRVRKPEAEEQPKVDAKAARAAKARALLVPLDPNDDPTGEKLSQDVIDKTVKAFERFGLDLADLEDWEKMDSPDWTESVRVNLLEVHRLLKAEQIEGADVKALIKEHKDC